MNDFQSHAKNLEKTMYNPLPLDKNDLILVISPAGSVTACQLNFGISLLEEEGFQVELGKHVYDKNGLFAGTDEDRAKDLQWALDHPKAKVIWMSRGGYGAIRTIQQTNWDRFQSNPKWIIGFSDVTLFLQKCNNLDIASIHAPMIALFNDNEKMARKTIQLLQGVKQTISWKSDRNNQDIEIHGTVVGGNLSILYSLRSTPYDIDYTDKILFIEDIDEYHYHIDRMLESFSVSGIFDQIRALVIGSFTYIKEGTSPMPYDIEQTFLEIANKHNIPLFLGAPIGHISNNNPIILGSHISIKRENNQHTISYY
ncbi:LD-carboxypeptidase [Halosquirtibacter laminarini]|uniref:LD-carboxypeptidase n=1 Tax=Halosquirtibacter laminarini TaxID=3374600 RepID=A0AC61NPD7_9BACT|nr:LD-carboxypeptidase [Prolixibacteraceae bacterium]